MFKFGITERGDAGLDFSWTAKMDKVDAAIIISKHLNNKLIANLVKYKSKVIFHMTCTGYGGTIVEPNVPSLNVTLSQYSELEKAGFPSNQVVLRLDPIIPTERGIESASNVLYYFNETPINRVRYSFFLDMYPHVRKRFEDKGLPDPYVSNFKPSVGMVRGAMELIDDFRSLYSCFESCAEGTRDQAGCISRLDMDTLGIHDVELKGNSGQRKGCLCPSNKVELLERAKRCSSGCLYCYWRD